MQILDHQINQLNELKEYIQQQKDDFTFNISLWGIITALIISIAAFFGYQSMKEIKDDARKIARDVALEVAKREVDQIAAIVLKTSEKDKSKNDVKVDEKELNDPFKEEQ